jgi:hypothetical protein
LVLNERLFSFTRNKCLRFSDRPIEDLLCEAVAALVFQRPRVTESLLSGLNAKMGGALADLEEKGIWTGARGENLLLASQGTIRADKILLRGLGQRSDWDVSILSDGIMALGSALDKIGIKEFGIQIPFGDYITHLELSARQIVDPFLENHRMESDYLLTAIFSVKNDFGDPLLSAMVNRLKEYFHPLLDFSVVMDGGAKP